MKTTLTFTFTIALSFMLLAACNKRKDQPSAHKATDVHPEETHAQNTVSLTVRQQKMLGLTLGKVKQKNLTGTIRATGKLELAPQYKADVSAVMGGSVSKINVTEGQQVAEGDVLALLEHPDFVQMQVDLQQNSAQLAYLKQQFRRLQNLHTKGVSSGKDLQKAKAEYMSVKANTEGLKAKLAMLNLNVDAILAGKIYQVIPVISPISGFIKSVDIGMGKFVSPGGRLFEVVDNSRIHADLMVFEKDIFKVEDGQQVHFTVSNAPDQQYSATIYAVGKTFEKNPKAVHIHAKIKGSAEHLIPGMYIDGQIVVDSAPVTALPETAVVSDGEGSYVFVKVDGLGHQDSADEGITPDAPGQTLSFKQVPVSVGLKSDGWVEVSFLDPLPEDTQIAYTKAYKLISEMNKAEASHSH